MSTDSTTKEAPTTIQTLNTPTSFLSLPRELRDQIYELVLVHKQPIDPVYETDPRQKLTLGLLQVNKTVRREASLVIYSRNHFDLDLFDGERTLLFLKRIGRSNAELIRHIRFDFPELLSPDPSDVAFTHHSVSFIEGLASNCPMLSTLTVILYSMNTLLDDIGAPENPQLVTEAFSIVDTHLRAALSLQDILVEMCGGGPSDHVRGVMESLGWKLRI